MKNKPFYAILVMVCFLVMLSAPAIMASGNAKTSTVQSSPDCCKGAKSSEKCCTPSPACCPGVSKSSAKADADTKTRQLKAESSSEVSKVTLTKAKSDD